MVMVPGPSSFEKYRKKVVFVPPSHLEEGTLQECALLEGTLQKGTLQDTTLHEGTLQEAPGVGSLPQASGHCCNGAKGSRR